MLLLGGSGRRLSTATPAGGAAAAAAGLAAEQLGAIPLAFPAVCMWGSNTGVGKTLFSAGLAAACRRAGVSSGGEAFQWLCLSPVVSACTSEACLPQLPTQLTYLSPRATAALGAVPEARTDRLPS